MSNTLEKLLVEDKGLIRNIQIQFIVSDFINTSIDGYKTEYKPNETLVDYINETFMFLGRKLEEYPKQIKENIVKEFHSQMKTVKNYNMNTVKVSL